MLTTLIAAYCFLCIVISTPQDDYRNQLTSILATLTQGIQSSINLAQQTINASQAFASSNTLTLEVITEGCNEVRQQISSSISKAYIPYDLRSWNCTPISAENYN